MWKKKSMPAQHQQAAGGLGACAWPCKSDARFAQVGCCSSRWGVAAGLLMGPK